MWDTVLDEILDDIFGPSPVPSLSRGHSKEDVAVRRGKRKNRMVMQALVAKWRHQSSFHAASNRRHALHVKTQNLPFALIRKGMFKRAFLGKRKRKKHKTIKTKPTLISVHSRLDCLYPFAFCDGTPFLFPTPNTHHLFPFSFLFLTLLSVIEDVDSSHPDRAFPHCTISATRKVLNLGNFQKFAAAW